MTSSREDPAPACASVAAGRDACVAGGLTARFPAHDLMPLMLANAGRLDKFGA